MRYVDKKLDGKQGVPSPLLLAVREILKLRFSGSWDWLGIGGSENGRL